MIRLIYAKKGACGAYEMVAYKSGGGAMAEQTFWGLMTGQTDICIKATSQPGAWFAAALLNENPLCLGEGGSL